MDFLGEATFSGGDIVAIIQVPVLGKSYVVGQLATISYSTHRENFPVRALGRVNPMGVCRSGRTIGGTLIFNVFNRHVLYDLQCDLRIEYERILVANNYKNLRKNERRLFSNFLTDELPPFDVILNFAGEYCNECAKLVISGIRITDEGQIMSVEDLHIENQMKYFATDILLMEPMANGGE